MNARRNRRLAGTPLAQTRLEVTITDLLAAYELRHGFRNEGSRVIEVVYSFPIPLDAAFMGMEATIGGERRVAKVMPAARAARRYDDAIADGDSAVLLEQLEPGMLCVNLGNLRPCESGEVVLRFVTALEVSDRVARFGLPLVHRPRFGRYRMGVWATPQPDFAVEHPLEACIRVRGLLAGRPVQCTTQGARVGMGEEETIIDLSGAMLDRDLVLRFDLGDAGLSGQRWIEDGEGAIAALSFVPSRPAGAADPAAAPLDLCLVMDCSGSMAGDAIRQSRDALAAVAGQLGERDRVQVLRFGSSIRPMFRRGLRASGRVLDALRQLVPTVEADLGGTEMAAALDAAIAGMAPESANRVLLLVTDGAVQPRDIELARERARLARVRIFVVAVGGSAGVDALDPLAAATGGVLERAVPGEPIDEAVMRHARRARQRAPLAVHVDWQGPGVTAVPLGNVYEGDAVVALGFCEDREPREVQVSVPGLGTELSFPLEEAGTDPALRAWAGQRAWTHAPPAQRREFALWYGLVTSETSAVLVKVRDGADKVDGLPEMVPVAHMHPAGQAMPAGMRVACSIAPAAHGAIDIAPYLRRGGPVGPAACAAFPPIPPSGEAGGEEYSAASFINWLAPIPPGGEAYMEEDSVPLPILSEAGRAEAERILLRALVDALLVDPLERFSLEGLLERIPAERHALVRRYLAVTATALDQLRAAVRLLERLADAAGDGALDDDQAAAFAVLDAETREKPVPDFR